jgi:hypothetical protein
VHALAHLAVHALTHPAVHAAHSLAGLAVPSMHGAEAEAAWAKPAGPMTVRLRQGPSTGKHRRGCDAADQQHLLFHLCLQQLGNG